MKEIFSCVALWYLQGFYKLLRYHKKVSDAISLYERINFLH